MNEYVDVECWAGAWYGGINYSWRFEVSTWGRLRNAKTKKVYTLHEGNKGYLQICTCINGKNKNIRVHRCVAETFLHNPNRYEIVNHIDGNKQNNRLDNLEWCTRQYNYKHAVMMDLVDQDISYQLGINSQNGYYCGSNNGMAKLTESDVRYIREHYIPKGRGRKCNRKELARKFHVSVGLISRIMNYEIWTHV